MPNICRGLEGGGWASDSDSDSDFADAVVGGEEIDMDGVEGKEPEGEMWHVIEARMRPS
jgi:hypothetical protein